MPADYYFILDEDNNIKKASLEEWVDWMAIYHRRSIANDIINGIRVSTVFLGIDHNWGLGGPPILFETMIFGGPHDQWMDRYCTYEGAQQGHLIACKMAFGMHAETLIKAKRARQE